jgi:predicted ATP-dependent protease
LPLYLKAGAGAQLRQALDQYIRNLAKTVPTWFSEDAPNKTPEEVDTWFAKQAEQLLAVAIAGDVDAKAFAEYLSAIKRDTLENLEAFRPNTSGDNDGVLETVLSRYRVNLLVDNRHLECAPVIYDDDPSFQSLFGGVESVSESSNTPDFMRLRAGNLLKAHGGMLMLHLRDLDAGEQGNAGIIEKLHRFLRNGRIQIEDTGGSAGHSVVPHLLEPLPVKVKLVLIATHEEFYALQEEFPEFAGHFKILVDFVERFAASPEIYLAVSRYVAERCDTLGLKHFSAAAVAGLLRAMHRWVEDQARIGTNYAQLETLIIESASVSPLSAPLVEPADVETASRLRLLRHEHYEKELRDSITDGELMIRVQGREIGQINGLTHMELGEAGFGSPVRISARCYPGDRGIINISREVQMSGPNHDKGVLILQSWLAASFPGLAPLSLNASLVFEQEYYGVEGDSASCAELYALLSALSGLPLPQGIAVTGALNQHGEVLPIGGLNEKIEGYFRVCRNLGLDGKQGVLIPAANRLHLMLDDEVTQAVEAGQFHILSIGHVLEGIEYLTGMPIGNADEQGHYRPETVMGRVQRALEQFSDIRKNNQQTLSFLVRDRRN